MGTLRAVLRLIFFVLVTLVLVPPQLVYALVLKCCGKVRMTQAPIVRLWYKCVTYIFGLRVKVYGLDQMHLKTQSLYISNHSSYMDIMALGAYLLPFFIAKSDTADWPVFGSLIKIGGTLFISRKRRALPQQMKLIRDALRAGKSLLLFPEGTTSDGLQILPFKSSLLNVLYTDMRSLPVTPVCLSYQSVNKKSFSESNKDLVSWYGDGPAFVPHLWELMKQSSIAIRIDILKPLQSTDFPDAKALTHALKLDVTDVFERNRPVIADKLLK